MKKIFLFSTIITLVLVVSFAINHSIVNSQTQSGQNSPNVSDPCIKKYMDTYQMSQDKAKEECYPEQDDSSQTGSGTNSQDDCIKKYMSQTGNTYEDAKAKCTPVVPVYVPPVVSPKETTPLEACIQKYLNSGYSYETAKKNCSQEVPTQSQEPELRSSADDCVEKYVSVLNISYADAKAKCTNISQPTATAVQGIEKMSDCAALEKQLSQLTQNINLAQGQATDAVMAEIQKIKEKIISACQKVTAVTTTDPCVEARKKIFEYQEQLKKGLSQEEQTKVNNAIEALKNRLQNCGLQQATPTVKNPCDEIVSLKSTYEAMVKKEVQIKELIDKGELDKSALDDLYRQMEFLKKKLEQMQLACQQGNKPEESPCARLAKLELLYSQSQGADLAKEIIALKERCRAQDLSSEKVETLAGAQEAYKNKLMAVVEGTFGQDQVDNLKLTEEQKDKLVNEVVQKANELDLRGITIVDKVNIGKGKVSLDDIQAPLVKVLLDLKGQGISIDPSKSEITEIDDDVTWVVKIDDDVSWLTKEGKLVGTNSGKTINVLPSEIEGKIGAKPVSIEIQDKGTPRYLAKVEATGKLFGFIPISAPKTFQVDAENGQTRQSSSWWSFLVRY